MRLALAFFAFCAAAPVWAQGACAERQAIIARLASVYGETLQNIGLHQDGNVVEIYASAATGTWTILQTRPDGTACLIAAGEMWQAAIAGPTGHPL
jgi:hypothetical protein